MTEPGRWCGYREDVAVLALDGLVHVELAKRIIGQLAAAGLLVRTAYYVPSLDELLRTYRALGYHLYRGMGQSGVRWVMCRETHDALAKQYEQKRAPAPMTFDSSFWRSEAGQELPTATLEMEVHAVIRRARAWTDPGSLFGVPIRIDPAARSPLLEVDSDATKERAHVSD